MNSAAGTIKKVVLEINQSLERGDRLRLLNCIPPLEWRALQETLLQHIESVTQFVTDPNTTNTAYYAGGLEALRLLFADLDESRDEGGKTS